MGFDGFIITDNANTGVFMDAEQMIEAGGDSKLTYMDQSSMWSFDETDPTQYYYAREAMHHLLYTTANSNAMNGAAPGAQYAPGTQKIPMIMTVINVVGVAGLR